VGVGTRDGKPKKRGKREKVEDVREAKGEVEV
jgi:hypothetical protein